MERDLLKKFIAWKGSKQRKPLLLDGARQVGKWTFASVSPNFLQKWRNYVLTFANFG